MTQSARHLLKALIVIFHFSFWSSPSHAQVNWLLILNQKTNDLYLQGKYDQAVVVGNEALIFAERDRGPDHPDTAESLNNLAELYRVQGQYVRAEELFKRSLAINQKALGPVHPSIATNLNNLALVSQEQGLYVQAEELFKRTLSMMEKVFGPNDIDLAQSLNNIATLYLDMGQYELAEPLYLRALNIREKVLGPIHRDVAESLTNLSAFYLRKNDLVQAEIVTKRGLLIFERTLGADHAHVASILNNQAFLYALRGQYDQAEQLYLRVLKILERALGLDHPRVAGILINLAELYGSKRQYALAEPLFKRAILILEKAVGPSHPDVALALNNLAGLYAIQGWHDQAEPLYLRGLLIIENSFGPDHENIAHSINNLALLYATQGRHSEAEALYVRSLKIIEKVLGSDHPDVAVRLNNLGMLYAAQSRYAEAETYYKRSLAINEKVFGSNHPKLGLIFDNLSSLYVSHSNFSDGLTAIRKSSKIMIGMSTNYSQNSPPKPSEKSIIDVERFERHALLILKMLPVANNLKPLISESFSVAQYARIGSTGTALAQMALRASASSPDLARMVREHQDTFDTWGRFNKQFLGAIGKPGDQRSENQENRLRQKLDEAETNIGRLNAELQRDFPQYRELVGSDPLGVADAQKLLKADEALVSYLVTAKETLLWVIRSDGAEMISLDTGGGDLSKQVAMLRQGVNIEGNVPAFPYSVAHDLYQTIFAPAVPHLVGVKHIMVVADGPLQSLPFGMLLSGSVTSGQDKSIPWLIRKYAFTNLPAVTSLRALRRFSKKQTASEPFLGFGDPILKGTQEESRGVSVAKLFASGAVADTSEVRRLGRLPETSEELKAIARTLKSTESNIFLQAAATERQVKTMNLMPYRVLAFSTHGLLSGEFKGLAEPALVLTPPEEPSDFDDGLLTASEVAGLKLNADWVILSACNTAGPDGTPGADGFSGLAKAFFYAGSQTLLVSHWSVDSIATVALITQMFAEAEKGIGRAEALRRSMLALIDHPTDKLLRHPAMWAPFVVVGEGSNGLH